MNSLIPIERVENKIYLIRGQKVMIDRDLAELYGVKTFNLNKAVRRNLKRFPSDFMFQLTSKEYGALRFQTGILKRGRHSKYLPYVFTQEGVAMLSSVLKSERAVLVNISIMRAFVRLNRILASHVEVSKKLKELENKTLKNEKDIKAIVEVIRQLTSVKPSAIGFRVCGCL